MTVDVTPRLPASPLPPAPLSPDTQAAIDYVRDLQRDGRLLLRHIARRADRSLAAADPTAGLAGGAPLLPVLTTDPEVVARERSLLGTLATCVDALSRQAAPATASTIRLTSAYLRMVVEGKEPPPEVQRRVRTVRWVIWGIMAFAVLAMVSALMLLAHVDDGRRAVQQLQAVRQELRATYDELGKLPAGAWVPPEAAGRATQPAAGPVDARYRDFCDDRAQGRMPSGGAEGVRAHALCSQLAEASLREALVFLRLEAWNCRTYRFFTPWRLYGEGCGLPPGVPPALEAPLNDKHWARTEIRTGASISVLTGFVLPLLLGSIGGCAYVLRRLDQKLSDYTLEVRDGWHAVLRVLLATMLGGLLGVVWSGEQPVQLGGFALSLAATAFFVGFALEAVFTVIEAMVDGVAGKLRAPPPAPVPVVVQGVSPAQLGPAGG